jgi:hypothetical protein
MNNKLTVNLLLFLTILWSYSPAGFTLAPQDGYRVFKQYVLDPEGDGVNGKIQLLVDSGRGARRQRNGLLRIVS